MSLPDEKDILKSGVDPVEDIEVVSDIEDALDATPEVIIEDDTPPKDRNRRPLNEPAEPSDEELDGYSEAVKRRMQKMKHGIHDERRAKEAALRERDEAVALARRLYEEKQSLETRHAQGEAVIVEQAKAKAEMAMAEAKRAYKEAYEFGDAEAMADAQERMATVAYERQQAEAWAKQQASRKEIARQEDAPVVQNTQTARASVPEPDADAVSWAQRNTWFGQNKVMTSAAYGIHDELVESGLDPRYDADEYYKQLNSRLREVFPTYEWGDAPAKKKVTSVVAPVNRTSKTATRVTLTKSQYAVARRLGLTPEQYAVEVAKLEG